MGEKKKEVSVRRKRQIIWDYQFLGQFQDTKEQRTHERTPLYAFPLPRYVSSQRAQSVAFLPCVPPSRWWRTAIRPSQCQCWRERRLRRAEGREKREKRAGSWESEKKFEEERKHGVADGVGFGGECSGERREKVAFAIPIAAFSHRASAGFVPVFQSLVSAGC